MYGFYNIIEWDGSIELVSIRTLNKDEEGYYANIMGEAWYESKRVVMMYNDCTKHIVSERYAYDVLLASLAPSWQLNPQPVQCWSPKL